jgi:hypothetical protein
LFLFDLDLGRPPTKVSSGCGGSVSEHTVVRIERERDGASVDELTTGRSRSLLARDARRTRVDRSSRGVLTTS